MGNKHTSMKLGLLALVITFALAATMVLIGSQSVTAGGTASAPEIEGTWLATVTIPDGPPPFPSLLTYARGGALTVTDSSVAPALGNVYQGTWTKTGSRKFAFTFLGFQFDDAGVLTGYIRARETIQLQPGGRAYNGTTTLEFLDLNLDVVGTASSTSQATRVNAQ